MVCYLCIGVIGVLLGGGGRVKSGKWECGIGFSKDGVVGYEVWCRV